MIELKSNRLIIRQADNNDIEEIISFYSLNRDFLLDFEPKRESSFYSSDFWEKRLVEEKNAGTIRFFILKINEPNKIIGTVSISGVIRGAFQAGYLGYALDENSQGEGYMTEALRRIIKFSFENLNLHRLMANSMISNKRSLKLLSNLGFEIEGTAKKYLFINEKWEDHILTSIVNPNWKNN